MVTSAFAHPSSSSGQLHGSPRNFTQILMKVQRATQRIASTLDFDMLLDRIVTDIAATLGNVEVAVWLREESSGDFVLCGVRGCTKFFKGHRLQMGTGMVGYCAATGKMRYAPDVRREPRYIACEPQTRSEVTAPLMRAGQVVGVISIDHEEVNAFSGGQLAVIQALAGNIAVAMENARAFANEREARQRMQRESAEARAIQQALFLKPVPLVPGFAFETVWHPAGAVAGDWFDFIELGGQRYGIALADVSGKGMPAALLMSAARALLRSVAPLCAGPAATLAHLNRSLVEDFPSGKFVTMIFAVLDARRRELTLASAGHLPPLVVNGACGFLELDTGLPLGLGESAYPEQTIHLVPGSRVLLYTDGITEAANPAEEEYGAQRLKDFFSRPGACVDDLIAEVRRFSAGSEHMDDATAVVIRRR